MIKLILRDIFQMILHVESENVIKFSMSRTSDQ